MTIDLNDYPLWSIFLVSFISILGGKRHLRARSGHAESLQSASAYAFRREQFKGVWAGPLGGSRCTKRGRREQMPTAEIEVTSLAGRQTLIAL
jgi:hypothetical protein